MNKGTLLVLSGVLMTAVVGPPAVHGATTNSRESATTAELPVARGLINKSLAGIQARGSYRELYNEWLTQGKVHYTVEGTADVSLRDHASVERYSLTMVKQHNTSTSSTKTKVEIILVGDPSGSQRGAERTGRTGKWRCNDIDNYNLLLEPLELREQDKKAFKTIGTSTVDGIPVWHIRRTVMLQGVPAYTDVFISRSDYTLVRETLAGSSTGNGNGISVDVSRYGEAVHIVLPAPCRSG